MKGGNIGRNQFREQAQPEDICWPTSSCSRRWSRKQFWGSCPPPPSVPPNSDASESGMLSRLGDLLFYTIAEGQERIPIHKFTTVSWPLLVQTPHSLWSLQSGKKWVGHTQGREGVAAWVWRVQRGDGRYLGRRVDPLSVAGSQYLKTLWHEKWQETSSNAAVSPPPLVSKAVGSTFFCCWGWADYALGQIMRVRAFPEPTFQGLFFSLKALKATGLQTSDPRLRDCMSQMRRMVRESSSGGLLDRDLFQKWEPQKQELWPTLTATLWTDIPSQKGSLGSYTSNLHVIIYYIIRECSL